MGGGGADIAGAAAEVAETGATTGATRPLTPDEKKAFQKDAERQAVERDGGSGSGAGVPTEAYDEDPEEPTFDDNCAGDDPSVMCDPDDDP